MSKNKNNRAQAYSDKQRASASKNKVNISKTVPLAITKPAAPETEQSALKAMPEENEKTPEALEPAVEMVQQAEEIRKLQQKIEQVRREQAEERKKLEEKEKSLNEQSRDLNRQKQLQDTRQSTLKQQEAMLDERTAHMVEREDKLSSREKKLHDDLIVADQELLQRKVETENAVVQLRAKMMEKLRTEMAAVRESQMKQVDADVEAYTQKRYADLEAELEKKRSTQTEELNTKLENLRIAQTQELKKERADWERKKAEEQRELDDERTKNKKKEDELKNQKADLETQQNRLDGREDKLKDLQKANEEMPETIRRAEERVRGSMQRELNMEKETSQGLKKRLEAVEKQLTEYQSFEKTWGGKPDALKQEIKQLREDNVRYKEKINSLPSLGLQDELDEAKGRNEELVRQCENLREQAKIAKEDAEELQELRENRERQESALRLANLERDTACKEKEELQQKLNRYLRPEAQKQERDERVKELSIPYRTNIPKQNYNAQPKSELAWLQSIQRQCKDYGIVFPTRLLYAFHTALKIADWSSITILSGISGTGKSELPRLYARFGGINFYMASVQPNWDSQEAMLGYFNSIDNRFEATDLLRFLVQSVNRVETNILATDEDGQPKKDLHGNPVPKYLAPSQEPWPLGAYMSIVLLDELNLAHVEHYFAEFLSKLEARRGLILDDVPAINVNLGAGCEPYKLYLRRNVLWVGTMNQDETTKTLSDKVLDRSITITFPTPKTLESRPRMGELPSEACDHMLTYQRWNSWCKKNAESKNEEFQKQMEKYRKIIETLNEEMGKSGRAVGHRVWQSIEYYITNYPLVIENCKEETESTSMSTALHNAMDMAFEDQLVQKIMPKLRGIENNGSGAEQLDKIWKILSDAGFEDLKDDFNKARQYGYGEFFWNSAEYMKPIDIGRQPEETAGKTEQTADVQA